MAIGMFIPSSFIIQYSIFDIQNGLRMHCDTAWQRFHGKTPYGFTRIRLERPFGFLVPPSAWQGPFEPEIESGQHQQDIGHCRQGHDEAVHPGAKPVAVVKGLQKIAAAHIDA